MANTVSLIHLESLGKLPVHIKPAPVYLNSRAESQIKVANYVKEHPEALVFLGGLTENYSGIPSDEFTSIAKCIFPDGLPSDASKLSLLQKEYLHDGENSVMTMLRLGKINTIYRTATSKQSTIMDTQLNELHIHDISKMQKEAAMECIQEVLKEKPHVKKVILVHVNLPGFSQRCKDSGFNYEKIRTIP